MTGPIGLENARLRIAGIAAGEKAVRKWTKTVRFSPKTVRNSAKTVRFKCKMHNAKCKMIYRSFDLTIAVAFRQRTRNAKNPPASAKQISAKAVI